MAEVMEDLVGMAVGGKKKKRRREGGFFMTGCAMRNSQTRLSGDAQGGSVSERRGSAAIPAESALMTIRPNISVR